MSSDDIATLLDAVANLLGVLVWPAIVLAVVLRFSHQLQTLLENAGEFSLTGAGFGVALKRIQAQATAALAAAELEREGESGAAQAMMQQTKQAANVVANTLTPRTVRRIEGSTLLWVDDNPDNNFYERQLFDALGIEITTALSTEDALDKVGRRRFDVIISDMGRTADDRAGYTLLEQLRAAGNQTPFILYAGSRLPEHVAEARQRGAFGCTARPRELFEMVLAALSSST